jgi:hypothetical protein
MTRKKDVESFNEVPAPALLSLGPGWNPSLNPAAISPGNQAVAFAI